MSKWVQQARTSEASPGDGPKDSLFVTMLADDNNALEITDDQLIEEALFYLLAGVYTSALSSTIAIYLSLSHPDVLQKLRAELSQIPKDKHGVPRYEDLKEAPYLVSNMCPVSGWSFLCLRRLKTAVIKETLRLYPTGTPGYIPRDVPPQGLYYGGFFIPGGVRYTEASDIP